MAEKTTDSIFSASKTKTTSTDYIYFHVPISTFNDALNSNLADSQRLKSAKLNFKISFDFHGLGTIRVWANWGFGKSDSVQYSHKGTAAGEVHSGTFGSGSGSLSKTVDITNYINSEYSQFKFYFSGYQGYTFSMQSENFQSKSYYVDSVTLTLEYETVTYTITWKNIDGNGKTETVTVDRNTVPTHSTPDKADTAQYDYEFTGWSPSIVAATADATYTAVFKSTIKRYGLTVSAGTGGSVTDGNVNNYSGGTYDYGTIITLTAKPNANYRFVKWSDGLTSDTRVVAITGTASYTAIFELKSYAVTFKDDNGTVLKTETVQHGSKPTPPANPEKADTAQWDYTFDGWYDGNGNKWTSSTTITGDTTFTARYSSVVQKYIVRWFNYDRTLLETDENVPYGTKPTYNGATPTKEGNAEHSYQFAGWNYDTENGITPTLGTTYIDITAQFREIDNTYTVKWVNDGVVIEEDEAVPYGAQPDYNGATPTKESDAQYDYDFIGWSVSVNDPAKPDTELEKVKGDIIYTAVYSKTVRQYAIKVILFDKEVEGVYAYGTEFAINAPAVTGYKFVKWSDGNTDSYRVFIVTGVATYQAVYERMPIPAKVGTEQVTGIYIVPDTNTIVYVISGTVPTVTIKTDTVDDWNFEVSNSVPDNSYPLEKLFINGTRIW